MLILCSIIVSAGEIRDTLTVVPSVSEPFAMEAEMSLEDAELFFCADSLLAIAGRGLPIDTTMIPAARLYGFRWDNNFVNPYKVNVLELTDTVLVSLSGYHHPVNNVVTSEFGFRSGWTFHYGIDVRLRVGDSIHSAFDGMVRIAKRISTYGNYVVIRHFNGLETVYGHLSKILVKPGDIIKGGEVLGLGGNTGRSTGPHLHYELRYMGQPLPPRDLINFDTFACVSDTLVVSPAAFAYLHEVNKVRFYTIRSGDTLSHIALRLGVSVTTLCRLNNISTKTILRIGRRLRYT